jgi:glutaredoxin-dependent peroxiredoxin
MLAEFEALNAQVVGVSADHVATLEAFTKQNNIKHLLLSDFRRQMLPAYDAMVSDEKSPIYRYGKRAYFVIDRTGTIRFVKIQENALDLLDPSEVLKALKESGAS